MEDYILINRNLINWEWYNDSEMVHLFIHLIIKVNHTTIRWQNIEIEKGQLTTSQRILSRETGLSEQQVKTCLKRLKKSDEIEIKEIKAINKYLLITIWNYDNWQQPTNN